MVCWIQTVQNSIVNGNGWILVTTRNGKGLAKCDLNADGTVDLLGTNSNGPVFISDNTIDFFRGPLFLWVSNASNGNWITLNLSGRQSIDGTGSNADGIGARVRLYADVDGSGNSKAQVQDVLGSSSFLGMNCVDSALRYWRCHGCRPHRNRVA